MQQYLDLVSAIQSKGTYKPAARENMPGTQSLFGYQFRHDLSTGFPLLTTKRMFWKGVLIELLWFMNGDTNVKFLENNGVKIWSEDAYNYYLKKCKENNIISILPFEDFIVNIRSGNLKTNIDGYELGDCGYQYGKVWRDWEIETGYKEVWVDQLKNVINSLRNNPESRRHLVTALDPAHENDLALYWCHAMFQFNCRPIGFAERREIAVQMGLMTKGDRLNDDGSIMFKDGVLAVVEDKFNEFQQSVDLSTVKYQSDAYLDYFKVPQYKLDCQLYQRSADIFLGVPFNIASYALLTEIIAKMCNMIPGEFIHTFGDVHIYDNHKESVNEQLTRTPGKLPMVNISSDFIDWSQSLDFVLKKLIDEEHWTSAITLLDYQPQSAIKGELSTGLKK